jgi:fatty acid desaturase
MSIVSSTPLLPQKDARELCRDLFLPRAAVYWSDLLGSAALGWGAFVLAVRAPAWSFEHAALSVVGALALYRAVLFTHELTHAAKSALPGFPAAWDALIGVPLMLPSFMYQEVHTLHHRRSVYGTVGDPEYLPFGVGPRRRIVRYLLEPLLLPAFLFVRYALLAPLSALLGGRLRALTVRAASSLAINYAFRRESPPVWLRRRWIVTETAACLGAWAVVASIATGALPLAVATQWYGTTAAVGFVNALRTLGAHRYRNAGGELDVAGQLVDSVNVPGRWWTELWAPVGLRYHGLHHFLPDLPYHALGTAHRRLVAALPPDSPYFRTVASGLWPALGALWRDAGVRSAPQSGLVGAPAETGAA